jgi:SAM-dependent methyltransferase
MLKDIQDAYGHQLYDCYKGRSVVEVVERDDGFIGTSMIYPRYYLAVFKAWSPRERKAMQYAKGRVFDIGCGGGKNSLYLQNRGHDVLGIDISPLAVKVCKLRGLRRAKVMSITDVNQRLGVFDTVLMMGNNFGLFGNPAKAKKLLRKIHGITSYGATIIAESLDPYRTKDPAHLSYHERNRRRGRLGGALRLRVRYRKYATPWFEYLIVSKNEMKNILKGTGWKVKRFIEPKAPAYIAVITKSRT